MAGTTGENSRVENGKKLEGQCTYLHCRFKVTAVAAAGAATETSRFVGRVAGNWLRRFKMRM